MIKPPLPYDEAERLVALRALNVLDTPAEERFDRITRLLARLLDVPIAAVALVDSDRQWFKSIVGLNATGIPRDVSFCGHTIVARRTVVVPDATEDERFHDNPLVVADPSIRFYAGQPLQGTGGHMVGALCAIDTQPRGLTAADEAILRDLAALVERELNLTEIAVLEGKVIEAQATIERLLHCVLPAAIADELRDGPRLIAEQHPAATILFADIEGFSSLAADLPPDQLLGWLNGVFSIFDELAANYGLEKIKTIGDAYMVAAGVPLPRSDHVEAMVEMALQMQRRTEGLQTPGGTLLRLRIGIHTGAVIAGVIGTSKFAYDLWGHTVNVASRMESTGLPGAIQVSEAVHGCLEGKYRFERRGTFPMKGVGQLTTYLLTGKITDPVETR
ncbi:MAG TPA: adenylate/guanylate cyclase domain-containing protein [Stellaceae bacterium]